jgi:hypothetical protein
VAAILAGLLFIASDLLDLAADPAADSGGFDAFVREGTPSALLVFQSGLTLLAGMCCSSSARSAST